MLVAPLDLRTQLVEEIRATGAAAADGKDARIRIKVNNLTDSEVIDELYKASQSGAEVEIVARSICTLRPSVTGLSERIRVRSVLGRFLEHSRLFAFERDGEKLYLLGSADLMPRNLDGRIEIVVPVEDGRAQLEMDRAFEALLADNVSAWELRRDGSWQRVRPKKGARSKGTQAGLMRSTRARARRRATLRRAS